MVIDVSVIITCFNKEQFLEQAINSVLNQSAQAKEIIVIHDGCQENALIHTKVKSVFLPVNTGVSNARNEGVRISQSPLLLFLDADDVISPDCLEKMWRAIVKGADIAYPEIYFWESINPQLPPIVPKVDVNLVKKKSKLPIPITSMMKREVFDSVGGFRKFTVLEDLDFWLRALCNGYTFKKTTTLFWYRQNVGSRNYTDLDTKKAALKEIFSQFQIEGDRIWLKK